MYIPNLLLELLDDIQFLRVFCNLLYSDSAKFSFAYFYTHFYINFLNMKNTNRRNRDNFVLYIFFIKKSP